MIASLTITGLGPHAGETCVEFPDARGRFEIRGASRIGKSTVLDALCFVLWGTDRHGAPLPVEAINGDRATVELVTGSGTVLRRVMDAKRRTTRVVTKRGAQPADCRTEEAFREHIGAALSRVIAAEKSQHAAARLAMVPMSWVPLAGGNARALRDVLTAMLPPADLGAEVDRILAETGHRRVTGDPSTVKAAEASRADANRAAATAKGRAEGDAARVRELEQPLPAGPDADAVKRAREVLAAFGAWDLYDAAVKGRADAEAAHGRAVAARDTWRAARAALDTREPKVDAAAARAAEEQEKRVTGIVEAERRGVAALATKAAEARAKLEATRAALANPVVERVAAAAGGVVEDVAPPLSAPAEGGPLFTRVTLTCPACNQPLPS